MLAFFSFSTFCAMFSAIKSAAPNGSSGGEEDIKEKCYHKRWGGINLQFAYLRTCHIVVVLRLICLQNFSSLRALFAEIFFFDGGKRHRHGGKCWINFMTMRQVWEKGNKRVFLCRRCRNRTMRKQMENSDLPLGMAHWHFDDADADVFKTVLLFSRHKALDIYAVSEHKTKDCVCVPALLSAVSLPVTRSFRFCFHFQFRRGLLNLSRDSYDWRAKAPRNILDCRRAETDK